MISLTFGYHFNHKIEPNTLPKNLTTITFGYKFNQKIELNILPEKLTSLTFGWKFDQKIEPNILPENLSNLTFNWIYFDNNDFYEHYIEMVNNIPSYYHVDIFFFKNIFFIDEPKWPIHVFKYQENRWSSHIYEIQDKYTHPIHGPITVLVNKETYQPYSSAKSALK